MRDSIPAQMRGKKVFVAMSGGVDSSVAAGLLVEAGCQVEGVTMCFSLGHPLSRRPSCCGVEGIEDARRAAKILGVPHHVLDFAADLQERVVDDFIREYVNGRTPNPCVRCNQHLKFGSLYRLVRSLGADYLATGHYARLVSSPSELLPPGSEPGGFAGDIRYALKKAVDRKKDQSYFLYSVAPETFARLCFPLGGMMKSEVREQAQRMGLANAQKPESQDICFVPSGGYQAFIQERLGGAGLGPGPFLDPDGNIVGQHQGIANYTIGQRDKLGLALGHPVYVYRIDKTTNTVSVGPEDYLYAQGLVAREINVLRPDILRGTVEVQVKIRYNAPEVKARLTSQEDGSWRVDFFAAQKAVTPGQSVVCYQGDDVLGGGLIEKALGPLGA